MASRSDHLRNWAPRTLAVVSFALAMLAAQPMAQASASAESHAVVVKDAGAQAAAEPRLVTASASTRAAAQIKMEAARPAMRVHILATVEIIKRLLLGNIQVQQVEREVAAVECFEPLCLETLIPATLSQAATTQSFLPSTHERAFAIRHCLLAPPLS